MCTAIRGTQIESELFSLLNPKSLNRKRGATVCQSQQVTSVKDRQRIEGAEAEAPEGTRQ